MKVTTKSEHSWAFYTPLAYFVFFFLQPILDHAGWKEWLLTGLGTIVFLVLYLGVLWVERKPWPLVGIGVMLLVGTLYVQFNGGATCFFIFAAALLPYVVETEGAAVKLLAVILVMPMCLLCSVVGVRLAGMEVTIFTQIGFVVLVGLASKNAILIVEFAKQQQESGVPLREATLEASRLRLRPILMTSFAFIFGVVPLVVATGAGAEMRRSLGQAVFAGMLGVTLFGIFLTPVFFFVIQRFGGVKQESSQHETNESRP